MNTDASLPNATVSWTPPTASDNSGEAVTMTSDYESGETFPIGKTKVTYTATDSYGNTASSAFNVVVTGKYDRQFINREILIKSSTIVHVYYIHHLFVILLKEAHFLKGIKLKSFQSEMLAI